MKSGKLFFGLETNWYWENSVTLNGQVYVPDATKAYVEFRCAHTIPVETNYGTMLHPEVVSRSYRSMKDQQFNWEHQVKQHDREGIVRDRMLGSVVDVWFPSPGEGGWKFTRDRSKAPGMHGVAVMHKMAEGADRLIGGHLSGRKKMSVSMEMDFLAPDSGFLVDTTMAIEGWGVGTPANLRDAGWIYVPWGEAPEDLKSCWSDTKGKIVKDWRGKKVSLLCGGLESQVHFMGLGMVGTAMESEAAILRIAAGKKLEDLEPGDVAYPMQSLLVEAEKYFQKNDK